MPAPPAAPDRPQGGRKQNRRDAILVAAAELFARKGFVATGIDEIGSGAGISGPGVYRYFSSKDEILKSLIQRATDRFVAVQESPLQSTMPPEEMLERMVEDQVQTTVANAALATVAWTEQRHLSPETRALVRRIHRLRSAEWVHVLSRVLPGRTDLELMTIVDGVYGMVRLGAIEASDLDPERSQALLKDMAMRALLLHDSKDPRSSHPDGARRTVRTAKSRGARTANG